MNLETDETRFADRICDALERRVKHLGNVHCESTNDWRTQAEPIFIVVDDDNLKSTGHQSPTGRLRPPRAGSFKEVFKCNDNLGRELAVKKLKTRLAGSEDFAREMETLAQLDHPHIPPILGRGITTEGCPFFLTRWMEATLQDKINEQHKIGKEEVSTLRKSQLFVWFLQICEAVEHAHRKRWVHADIKPTNVLIDRADVAYLGDWGAARHMGNSPVLACKPDPSMNIGHIKDESRSTVRQNQDTNIHSVECGPYTRGFAPKEQELRGELSPRCDVHALGVTLEQITCSLSSAGANKALLRIIEKATEPNPRKRYDTVSALRADLANWIHRQPIGGIQEPLASICSRWYFHNQKYVLIAASCLLLLAVSVGFAYKREMANSQRLRDANTTVGSQKKALQQTTTKLKRQSAELVQANHELKQRTFELLESYQQLAHQQFERGMLNNAKDVLIKVRELAEESFAYESTLKHRFILAQTLNDLGLAQHKTPGPGHLAAKSLNAALMHASILLEKDSSNIEYQRLMVAVRTNKGMSDLQVKGPSTAIETYRPALKLAKEMKENAGLSAEQRLQAEVSYVRLLGNLADSMYAAKQASYGSRKIHEAAEYRISEIETRTECINGARELMKKYQPQSKSKLRQVLEYFNSIQGCRLAFSYHQNGDNAKATSAIVRVLQFSRTPEVFEENNPHQQYLVALLLTLVSSSIDGIADASTEQAQLDKRAIRCLFRASSFGYFDSEDRVKEFCDEPTFKSLERHDEFLALRTRLCQQVRRKK